MLYLHQLTIPVPGILSARDDVIKWKHFPRYWPFVRGIHRSPMNSPHKDQWGGALMFSLTCARINSWVNNGEAGDLRRHRGHYDVIVVRGVRVPGCWRPNIPEVSTIVGDALPPCATPRHQQPRYWLRRINSFLPFTSQDSYCLSYINVESFYTPVWKTGRIMPWQCPSVRLSVRLSVRPSVRPRFPDFSSTCFEISIWNLVYAFSRWHDMSSLSCITIGSIWPSLQPKVGQTYFLQSWPHKSR